MNKQGKTSTIFLVVLSVFFVCTTGISVFFFLKEAETSNTLKVQVGELQKAQDQLQGDLTETKKQLQVTDEKKKAAEKAIDDLKNEIQVEQGLKAELQKQNADMKTALDQEKQSKEELRAQMSKDISSAEQKATELQQKLDIVAKQKDEIESHRADLQKQFDSLKAKLDELSAQGPQASAPAPETEAATPTPAPAQGKSSAATEAGVPLGKIVVNSEAGATATPAERGKIITIDSDAEFLIVALGAKDGVKAEQTLSVMHGDKYVGDVKVTRVLEDMCAVDLVPPLNSQAVSKDDRVVLKK